MLCPCCAGLLNLPFPSSFRFSKTTTPLDCAVGATLFPTPTQSNHAPVTMANHVDIAVCDRLDPFAYKLANRILLRFPDICKLSELRKFLESRHIQIPGACHCGAWLQANLHPLHTQILACCSQPWHRRGLTWQSAFFVVGRPRSQL